MKTLTQISLSLLTFSVLATPVVFGQTVQALSPSTNFRSVNVCAARQTTPPPCIRNTLGPSDFRFQRHNLGNGDAKRQWRGNLDDYTSGGQRFHHSELHRHDNLPSQQRDDDRDGVVGGKGNR